jgi:hypothetical protein
MPVVVVGWALVAVEAAALVCFRPALGTPAPVTASIELVSTSRGAGRPLEPGVDCPSACGTSRMKRTVDNFMGRIAYGSAAG